MLTPFDDYPIHQTSAPIGQPATGDPNHYDRYWFNGYHRGGDFFLGAAMGHYPNRGVIDAAFSVVSDGVQHSVFASGRMPLDRRTEVGPVRIEVTEPLRTIRLVVSPNDHGLEADLTYRARTEAMEEPRQQIVRNNALMMDYTRLTQWGTWEGTIKLPDGRALTADPETTYATRDRSWGVRPVGAQAATNFAPEPPQIFWLWAPLHFPGFCTHLALFERADGERWLEQALIVPLLTDDAKPQHLGHTEVSLDWIPGRREISSANLVPHRKDGSALDPITFERILTFRMRGIGYMHPQFAHGTNHGELEIAGESIGSEDFSPLEPASIHVQTLCHVSFGARHGIGVLEQLAVGPHQPSGLKGLLDGFEDAQ
jgi:hypothetical protein